LSHVATNRIVVDAEGIRDSLAWDITIATESSSLTDANVVVLGIQLGRGGGEKVEG